MLDAILEYRENVDATWWLWYVPWCDVEWSHSEFWVSKFCVDLDLWWISSSFEMAFAIHNICCCDHWHFRIKKLDTLLAGTTRVDFEPRISRLGGDWRYRPTWRTVCWFEIKLDVILSSATLCRWCTPWTVHHVCKTHSMYSGIIHREMDLQRSALCFTCPPN